MAAGNNGVMFVVIVLSCIFGICSAKSYVVGGTTGWTIPTSSSFYSSWASQQKLLVGDVLVFTFPAGAHTVAQVSKANYDSCTSAATLGPVMATAPANITLTKPGTHYFICTITGHCGANQKLTVTTSALAATPTVSPKSSPIASPKSSPTASPKSSPTPAPSPTPISSPASSPAPTPTPAPSATSPAPTPVSEAPGSEPTVPASASSPAGSSDGGSVSPPEGNFAACTSVRLFSLLSVVALALVV